MFPIEKGVMLHWKTASCPLHRYATTVAETVESSSGSSEVIEMLKRRISIVKRMPASGALKMPAMAPAAPQPSIRVMSR